MTSNDVSSKTKRQYYILDNLGRLVNERTIQYLAKLSWNIMIHLYYPLCMDCSEIDLTPGSEIFA